MPSQPSMLTHETVESLKRLVFKHKGSIDLPNPGRWESMTDNEIWISMVGQVGVVGSSAPAEKMTQALRARENWYGALVAMPTEQRRSAIHGLLRSFGIRYVSEDPKECLKTNALLKNLARVESHGGPRRYLARLASTSDEHARVATVIRELAYIKNKGARDFLIGVGLIENAIAFDVRIKNSLRALGAALPEDVSSNPAVYKQLESELIVKVCRPCGVSGAVLDRVLYQKYAEIMALAPA